MRRSGKEAGGGIEDLGRDGADFLQGGDEGGVVELLVAGHEVGGQARGEPIGFGSGDRKRNVDRELASTDSDGCVEILTLLDAPASRIALRAHHARVPSNRVLRRHDYAVVHLGRPRIAAVGPLHHCSKSTSPRALQRQSHARTALQSSAESRDNALRRARGEASTVALVEQLASGTGQSRLGDAVCSTSSLCAWSGESEA